MRVDASPGMRFGRLVIIDEAPSRRQPSGQIRRCMSCKCDCGNTAIVQLSNLRSGHSTSCGCVQKSAGRKNKTHGSTGSPEYRAWQDMIQRCYNPLRPRYPKYGGRGITVCQRWRESFEAFVEDMGKRPSSRHSIDRIDNDKEYCKDNCQWATKTQQARNTSRNIMLTHQGEMRCLAEWSEHLGISYHTLYDRLQSGWSVSSALSRPVGG